MCDWGECVCVDDVWEMRRDETRRDEMRSSARSSARSSVNLRIDDGCVDVCEG